MLNSHTISVPRNISDLRIKHYRLINELEKINGNANITEKIKVNSLFTNISEDELRPYSLESNNLLYSQILKVFDTYIPRPFLPESVTYENKKYNLVKDYSKMPTGWIVDIYHLDFQKNPSTLPAMCYIEDGMTYAQMDENKNILNLSTDRVKVFEKHFPLNTFCDLTNFFLSIYVNWKGKFIRTEITAKKIKEMKEALSLLNGKISLTK
jgi:hypothetical protein